MTEKIKVLPREMSLIGSLMSQVEAGKRAEATAQQLLSVIIERAGGDPDGNYELDGNELVPRSAE